MSYIQYEIDPTDPEKTAANKINAYAITFIGLTLFFADSFCLAFSISSLTKMFNKSYYNDFAIAIPWILGMVILNSLPFLYMSNNKKSLIKNIGLYLLLTFALLASIIGAAQLYNNSTLGLLTIFLSIVLIFISALLYVLKSRIDKNMSTNFFKNKIDIEDKPRIELSTEIKKAESTIIFCHKCGNKIPPDSHFCSFCGTAIPIVK